MLNVQASFVPPNVKTTASFDSDVISELSSENVDSTLGIIELEISPATYPFAELAITSLSPDCKVFASLTNSHLSKTALAVTVISHDEVNEPSSEVTTMVVLPTLRAVTKPV